MIYLEAQNRDPARPDIGVSFTKSVWPFLTAKGKEIDVVLFGASGRIPLLGRGGVEHLGPLAALDRETREKVRHFSFYGGNMNVVFRAISRSTIEALVAPWPLLQINDDKEFVPPSWSSHETEAFLSLVMDRPEGGACPLCQYARDTVVLKFNVEGDEGAVHGNDGEGPGRSDGEGEASAVLGGREAEDLAGGGRVHEAWGNWRVAAARRSVLVAFGGSCPG